MTSLHLLTALTVLAGAWALRALYLDAARQRRRADRLAARNAELRQALEDAEIDLQLWSEIHARAEAKDRHPSTQYGGGNLRVIK